MGDEQPLAGRRILIAEDNLFAALELEETVRRLGGTPVGPVARLEQALQVGGREALDGALLDVDLRGEHVFPLADLLEERRVPVIFASGYTNSQLFPDRFSRHPRLGKPYVTWELEARLRETVA